MLRTLTLTEKQLLVRLEARVDRGLAGTDDALDALLTIQRQRLHEEVNADFWDYCRQRWPTGERHIQRLFARAEVVTNVTAESPQSSSEDSEDDQIGHPATPKVREPNEAQARELNRLTGRPAAQKQVWDAVCIMAKAEGKRVTAKMVKEGVDQFLAAEAPDDPTPEKVKKDAAERERRATAEVDRDTVNTFAEKVRKTMRPVEKRFGNRAAVAVALGKIELAIADIYEATGTTP